MIRRLQPQLAQVEGITLFMQPVQDLTVEDRVSRTQFQYSLEDPDAKELAEWVPRFHRQSFRSLPSCATWPATSRTAACRPTLVIDRNTASRFGITPQMIDDTLYDAFGQRQISIMFTQLNQYHVVLELKPELQRSPEELKNIYIRSQQGGEVPLSAFTTFKPGTSPLVVNHQGQFPVVTVSFNLAPARRWETRSTAIDNAKKELGMPASVQATSRAPRRRFRLR